jgi:CheY-like chemotaxis protein
VRVAYLVQDLLFASKIEETASRLGADVQPARSPEGLHAAAAAADLVIVDLRLPDALRALELLAADPATAAVPSVGFVEHERLELMEAARARGCGTVFAKGVFARELPRLLGAEAH